MVFNKKPIAPPREPPAPKPNPLTMAERIELMLREKQSELQVLQADIERLNSDLLWLKTFPQVERIVEQLFKRFGSTAT